MKTNVLTGILLAMLLTVSAHAQSQSAEAKRGADRLTRDQKIERTKGELKEIGQDVKEKAKVVGEAISTEAQKAAAAIERKAEERKAKRGTARRDTV